MKDFNNSYDSLAADAKKILEGNNTESSESEELDEAIHPLVLSILKAAAIASGKMLLKKLLDKAENEKITPREYDKIAPQLDKSGALDKLKSANPKYRAAERGGRNPFDRGTLAYELFNDLEEETAKAISNGEEIVEAIRPNDVLVKKQQDKFDSSRQRPTLMFKPQEILRGLRKIVSPEAKKVLAAVYMDGNEIVDKRTNKTIAGMKLNIKLSDLAKDVEKWTKANVKPKAAAGDIKRDGDTRAIITIDNEMAAQLKKSIHDAKAKIKVRVMKRKDGAKVYIDTNDKASLDSALEKAGAMIQVD